MVSKSTVLAVGLLVGLIVGVVGAGSLIPAERTTGPTHSTSTATGCVAADSPRPGWVGQFSADGSGVVAVNFTIYHGSADIDLSTTLEERSDRRYHLAVTTAPGTGKGPVPDDCQPRTTLVAVVSLPTDYRALAVTVDGDPVVAVRAPEGSFPTFRPLNASVRVS